jgi:hypothetical protein
MNYLLLLIGLLATLYLFLPLVLVYVLKFLLRKFQFQASVRGILTYTDVMLRVPWTLNLSVIIKIDEVSIKPHRPKRFSEWANPVSWGFCRIHAQGLQVNLCLRDEFEKWSSDKIELL